MQNGEGKMEGERQQAKLDNVCSWASSGDNGRISLKAALGKVGQMVISDSIFEPKAQVTAYNFFTPTPSCFNADMQKGW